jgi:hypothetical protein
VIGAWRNAVASWGTTPAERAQRFPCDTLVAGADRELFRGITIAAPPPAVFRWLCQLRAAPYSYDWIDNRGRRSPRALTPGLEHLAAGQTFMTIFTLVDFEPDRHVTVHTTHWLFGEIGCTYLVERQGTGSRLVVKLRLRYPRPPLRPVARAVLPAADLVMMRKQLRTLARLAV